MEEICAFSGRTNHRTGGIQLLRKRSGWIATGTVVEEDRRDLVGRGPP